MDAFSEKRIIVVGGPTATGKTKLAAALCRAYNGEMVGADSMQVYRGLPIGTAAPTPEELGGVPAHLLGFLPPEKPFSVADYVTQATEMIDDIIRRKAVPVICGGTGLYISSLVNRIRFTDERPPPEVRETLYAEWDTSGGEKMLERLATLDPDYAQKLHPNDKKRILRALEESEWNGTTLTQRNAASLSQKPPFTSLLIGLDYPARADLYAATDARVDAMLAAGLLREAQHVYENRDSFTTAAQAIGYKEFFACFEGAATLEDCTQKLKQATRNYAKRQKTWFGRMDGIHWLDAASTSLTDEAGQLVTAFLNK